MDHAFAEDTINKGSYGIKNVHTRSAINGVSIPGPINESAQNDPLFTKAKEDYNNECCCTELFEYLANQCKEKDEYYFEKHSDEILDLQCRYLEASIQKLSEHLKFTYDPKIIEENSGENS